MNHRITAKEQRIALAYLEGRMTRAEVNREFGTQHLSGLHKVARIAKALLAKGVLRVVDNRA